MSPSKSFYVLLDVGNDASSEQINAAYQQMRQLYQELPDGAGKTARLALLERAHAVLSDPLRRSVYDASLAANDNGRIAPAAASSSPASVLPQNIVLPTELGIDSGRSHWKRNAFAIKVLLGATLALGPLIHYRNSAKLAKNRAEQIKVLQQEFNGGDAPAQDPRLTDLRNELRTLDKQERALDDEQDELQRQLNRDEIGNLIYETRRDETQKKQLQLREQQQQLRAQIQTLEQNGRRL